MSRLVIPLNRGFFNDGFWYFLSSTSLGGSDLSPQVMEKKLQSQTPEPIAELLKDGICLPLYFDGDCALDKAVVVMGDLTEEEESQWIGHIRSYLNIPCGEFMIMGGGLAEDLETALSQFEAPDPHFVYFQKFRLDPGKYQIDIYAYIGSLTVNTFWDELQADESLQSWWQRSHPNTPPPEWVQEVESEDYVDEDLGLLEYIVRLTPLSDDPPPLPEQEEETHWAGVFTRRKPEVCPPGIALTNYSTN